MLCPFHNPYSIHINIFKQTINQLQNFLSLKEMKHKEISFIRCNSVACIYLSVCTEQQSPVMCDQRSVYGFVVRILLCILSTWYKGTEIHKIQNHIETQLILQKHYDKTNFVCQINLCCLPVRLYQKYLLP